MSPVGAIESSALAVAMRQSLWLYPGVEIVHLIGIALLFGSIVVLDLRLLGLSRAIPVRRLAAHVLPWTIGSFVLIVPSGLMMFIAHATDFLRNPAFALKMALILAAGVNAAVFHAGAFRGAAGWDVGAPPPLAARAAGAASLALWVSVIACGRLLAYL
jgi:hypothetical protein